MKTILFLVLVPLATCSHKSHGEPVKDFCKKLSKDILWSITLDPHHRTWEEVKNHLGYKHTDHEESKIVEYEEKHVKVPKEFDSRKNWPQCADVIGNIKNQLACGSCWAVSSTSVMSDRICIHSKGKSKKSVSASDLMDCCKDCGQSCGGGDPQRAFNYWHTTGIVTGGQKPGEGCKSYRAKDEQCSKSCDKGTKLDYKKELTFGNAAYGLKNETQIQIDIAKNGPVTAAFQVFEDFMCYGGGVYHHGEGRSLGWHAVRVVGWGVEKDTPYWLIANSWGNVWGEHGYFKILRGRNECGIEKSEVSSGIPKL